MAEQNILESILGSAHTAKVKAKCKSTGEIVEVEHITGGSGIVAANSWYYGDTMITGRITKQGDDYIFDDSGILTPMKEKQMKEDAEKFVKRQKILFYAGIAIVIGIVAFIIIKKHKK